MSESVSKLRELLLDKDRRDISALSGRIDSVFEQAGSKERLKRSVAEVLAESIREVEGETDRRQELAGAVAPVIIETVRREVRASADELADSLHPHMGRMISAYVASAIKDMMAKMNRQLESGLSPRRWVMKLKSVATGRSEAELLLADMNALRVQELYLIRRGSGELIEHWEDVGAGEVAGTPVDGAGATRTGSNRDAVVSAFLTAINDFAGEAFQASDGGLQTLDVQSHRIYLRSSPGYLLAAKCGGLPTADTERLLDQVFAATIQTHRGVLSAQPNGQTPPQLQHLLPDLAQRLQHDLNAGAMEGAARGPNFAKWLLILAAVSMLGWLLWDKWLTWQTERTRTAVEAVLSGSVMGSYVSRVEVERGGQKVRLTGLAPSSDEKSTIIGAIHKLVGAANVEDRIEILPEPGDGGLQSFKRDVLESSASMTLQATQRAMQRARLRLQQVGTDFERLTQGAADTPARTALETSARRLTATASEIETLTQTTMRATVRDDLSGLQPRLEAMLTLLRQTADTVARARGEKGAPVQARPAAVADRQANVREEAEQVANAADTLWSEMVATERYLLRETVTQLSRRPLPAPVPTPVAITPRQLLGEWTRQNAIFFSADATYRDDAEAKRLLDALPELVQRAGVVLRIVGYTDDLGTSQRNSNISLERANRVRQELLDRGVPSARLAVVGRPAGPNLSQTTGLNSPNRRVEFEIGFEREGNGG